jgi:hypothetical protein
MGIIEQCQREHKGRRKSRINEKYKKKDQEEERETKGIDIHYCQNKVN